MKKRLAIITTHPIQYNAPLFKAIAENKNLDVKIFYTFSQVEKGQHYDPGFCKVIDWDIPLLDGYEFEFIENVAKKPGTFHFRGIINPQLNIELERWKPDAILLFGWSFYSHLCCMIHFHNKIPIIFRGDSHLIDEIGTLKKILRNIVLKWVYSRVKFALYVGTNNKDYYLKYGFKNEQLLFAPHAIDNERFAMNWQRLEEKALSKRELMGIGEDDIVFLFAGKLEPKKNPELLIRAFQNIRKKVHLVIVGNGVLEKYLKVKYCRENIHFIDFQNQSEMPWVYRIGDVFVLPSIGPQETWGLAVNEAMAASRSVIVSDKCGCAVDLIDIGKNGYVFESGNEVDLVEKMNLMLNKKLTKKLGEHSKFIIQDWSMEKVSTCIEQIVLINC